MHFLCGFLGVGTAVLVFLAGYRCGLKHRNPPQAVPSVRTAVRNDRATTDPVRWQEWMNFLSYDGGERPEIQR